MWNPNKAPLVTLPFRYPWCRVMTDGLHFLVARHPAYMQLAVGHIARYRLFLVDRALCPIILVNVSRSDGQKFQLYFSLYDEGGRYELVEWEEATAMECAGIIA